MAATRAIPVLAACLLAGCFVPDHDEVGFGAGGDDDDAADDDDAVNDDDSAPTDDDDSAPADDDDAVDDDDSAPTDDDDDTAPTDDDDDSSPADDDDDTAPDPPILLEIDGLGAASPVLDEQGLTAALVDPRFASRRFADTLSLAGERLGTATGAELRHPTPSPSTPCLGGPSALPCVLFDATNGLLLQPGGTPMQRTITLPTALSAGAWTLALLSPAGVAEAQIFVLQGEAGLACWDLDEDRVCDPLTEDHDGDGICAPADCQVPPALTSVEARLDAIEGDYATNTSLVALAEATSAELRVDTTWTTPGDFAHVEDAVREAFQWRIHHDATLTIEVIGTHAMTGELALSHPDGARLQLVGGSLTAGTDVLDFAGTHGVLVNGEDLGLLDNLVIQGSNSADTTGISATDGAVVTLGADVAVDGFFIGISAGRQGVIWADNTEVSSGASSCFYAWETGLIQATGSTATDCEVCYRATGDAFLKAAGSVATDCSLRAYQALFNAEIDAFAASGTSAGTCASVLYGSTMRAASFSCTVDTPTDDGGGSAVYAEYGASIVVTGPSVFESELGAVMIARHNSTIHATGGVTLHGDGGWVARAETASTLRADDAILSGGYTGGMLVQNGAVGQFADVTDPNNVLSSVDASSVLLE